MSLYLRFCMFIIVFGLLLVFKWVCFVFKNWVIDDLMKKLVLVIVICLLVVFIIWFLFRDVVKRISLDWNFVRGVVLFIVVWCNEYGGFVSVVGVFFFGIVCCVIKCLKVLVYVFCVVKWEEGKLNSFLIVVGIDECLYWEKGVVGFFVLCFIVIIISWCKKF